MKRRAWVWLLGCGLTWLTGGAAFAETEEEAPPAAAATAEVWAEIAEIKQSKLEEVLELREDERARFVDMYTRWEDVRWGYRERREELIEKLREATAAADPRALEAVLDELDALDAESRATESRLRKEFRGALSDEQYAKLLLFEDVFTRHLRRLVQEQTELPARDNK